MRAGRTRRALAVVPLLVLALAGCGGGSPSAPASAPLTGAAQSPATSPPSADAGSSPEIVAQAARADLAPCPPSDASVAARPDGLPDVTLACLGTKGARQVRLAGVRGTPMLVNVWAQWCGPCREEAPLLQRLHAAAGDRLLVLGVDWEDRDLWGRAFAAKEGLHYASVSDATDAFGLRRWAGGPPLSLLVDASGSVVAVQRGPFTSWDQLRGLVAGRLGVALPASGS